MRRKRALIITGVVAVLVVLVWFFPPFHVVALKGAREQQQASAVDAASAAARFWDTKLVPAAMHGLEVKELLPRLAKDGGMAGQPQDGAAGAAGATSFLVKGTGRVTTIEEEAVVVAIDGTAARVRLFTGLLFGNTVRDATGLLDMSAYPNSQDFNDLSTELNKIVETKVAPGLREKAAVGKLIRFAGCAELEEDTKVESLAIIPVRIDWL